MIVVRVELHSAINGEITELARMIIANDGTGTTATGQYYGVTLHGRSKEQLDAALKAKRVTRRGHVEDYPRQALHVWHLVGRMLANMGYASKKNSEAA